MAKPNTPAKPADTAKSFVLRIGETGKIDLAKAVPMLAGDWVQLKRLGVRLGANHNLIEDPEACLAFLLYFVQKCEPHIQLEHLETVPLGRVLKAVRWINETGQQDEDPN